MKAEALQAAIYTRLSTDATLVAALSTAWGITPIFADVPQVNGDNSAYYPYVTFGADVATMWDTKTSVGANVTFQIDVWSRAGNYLQVKQIATLIWQRIHYQSLTITGADEVLLMVESQNFSIDPDGETRRALITCRCLYDA
jgi:hypothetical protein